MLLFTYKCGIGRLIQGLLFGQCEIRCEQEMLINYDADPKYQFVRPFWLFPSSVSVA